MQGNFLRSKNKTAVNTFVLGPQGHVHVLGAPCQARSARGNEITPHRFGGVGVVVVVGLRQCTYATSFWRYMGGPCRKGWVVGRLGARRAVLVPHVVPGRERPGGSGVGVGGRVVEASKPATNGSTPVHRARPFLVITPTPSMWKGVR